MLVLVCASLPVAAAARCWDSCRLDFGAEIVGPEDMVLDQVTAGAPRLVVSAYDRRGDASGGGTGGLWAVDLRAGVPTARPLHVAGLEGCPLRPHGIALVQPDGDERTPRLYVISHNRPTDACPTAEGEACRGRLCHRIFVLRASGSDFVLEQALPTRGLRNPNDLVALPNGLVLLADTARNLPMLALEWARLWTSSRVMAFRDGSWTEVADDVRYASGIQASGDMLYVSSVFDEQVHVMRFDPASGDVVERYAPIHVGSGVDNLTWDTEGTALLVAAHPDQRAFVRHSRSAAEHSPSEVYRMNLACCAPTVQLLHRSEGCVIDAASVAVRYDDALYLGQVFGGGIARCTLPRSGRRAQIER